MSRAPTPVLQLEAAPPVCNIAITAQLLSRSVRAINRDLARGIMQPAPIPVLESSVGPRKKHKRRQWSKFAIEAWLKGEYLAFVRQAAPAAGPKTRRFFGAAKAHPMPAHRAGGYTPRAPSVAPIPPTGGTAVRVVTGS